MLLQKPYHKEHKPLSSSLAIILQNRSPDDSIGFWLCQYPLVLISTTYFTSILLKNHVFKDPSPKNNMLTQ